MEKIYAEVNNKVINRVFRNWVSDVAPVIDPGMLLIDISCKSPLPAEGDSVLIRTYAAVIEGKVVNIFTWSDDHAPLSDGITTMIDITELSNKPGIDWTYASGEFQPPPEVQQVSHPVLVISGLTASDVVNTIINLAAHEVTCKEGVTLTATVELRDQAGAIIPLTTSFRMPVQARDGREFVVLVSFQNGVANISIPFASSGVWMITEATINAALPAESQMSFVGFTAYVVV